MHEPVLSSRRETAGSITSDEAASIAPGGMGPERYVQCLSPEMQALAAMVSRVAVTSAPVLICGETGVGKSMLARQVHEYSPRGDAPLVVLHAVTATADAVNCLSTLGGHTVLLEEIGELAPAVQDSLVCLLNSASTDAGFRLLATTSQDIDALATRKILRSDLRYRIDVVRLEIPPLRQRPADVVFLAGHFLAFTSSVPSSPSVWTPATH